jgi:hypothetical protein
LCFGIPLLISGWFVTASTGTGLLPSPALVSLEDFKKLQNAVEKLSSSIKRLESNTNRLESNTNRLESNCRRLETYFNGLNREHLKLKKKVTYEISHSRAAVAAVPYMKGFQKTIQIFICLPALGAYHWLETRSVELWHPKNITMLK